MGDGGATFQAGLAGGLHLSGKVIFGIAESSFNWGQRADTWSNEHPFSPPPHGCKWAVTGPAPAISLISGHQGILKEKHSCFFSLFLPTLFRNQGRRAQVINDTEDSIELMLTASADPSGRACYCGGEVWGKKDAIQQGQVLLLHQDSNANCTEPRWRRTGQKAVLKDMEIIWDHELSNNQ